MGNWKQKVGSDLLAHIEDQQKRTERFRVLVQHNCGETLPQITGRFTVLKAFPLIGALLVELSPAEIEYLAKQRDIRFISADRSVSTCLNVAGPALGTPEAQAEGYNGEGVGVAVIDSGIYPHPDVEGAVDAFVDLNDGATSPYDLQGHGTHVSGIILGRGRVNPVYKGIAPRARLISIKVFGRDNVTTLGRLIEALSWIHTNALKYNIRVVNMSLGATSIEPYDLDPLCQAIRMLWEKNILLVASVGNEGQQGRRSVLTPGSCPYVLTVGAMNDFRTLTREDDSLAAFSSRGPTLDGFNKPDVVAPGVDIISLRATGSTLDRQLSQNRVGQYYFRLTGTSMAAPMVSGIAALIFQKRPDLNPDEVKAVIMATAEDRGGLATVQGMGYVAASAALRLLRSPRILWQGANLRVRLH